MDARVEMLNLTVCSVAVDKGEVKQSYINGGGNCTCTKFL